MPFQLDRSNPREVRSSCLARAFPHHDPPETSHHGASGLRRTTGLQTSNVPLKAHRVVNRYSEPPVGPDDALSTVLRRPALATSLSHAYCPVVIEPWIPFDASDD